MSDQEQTFKTGTEVYQYLVSHGWKVSQASVYNHLAKGWLKKGEDGQFSLGEVQKYAIKRLQKKDGSGETDEISERKRKAEADSAEAMARIKRVKAETMEGSFIPRSQYEQDLSARAQMFKTDLQVLAETLPPEMIKLVEGDQDRAPDLTQFLKNQFEEFLDRYSRPARFAV